MSRKQQLDRPGAPDGPPADDTGCTILHVDMDAFYASVSLLDHPELRGTPVIVGGGGTRGVVLSATYEARRAGVHSAMPMTRARRLCPQATILEPQPERYSAVSAAVMEVFREVTPLVEPLSLDEAFLDVSGAVRRLGRPTGIGETIRARVADEQGVTCSVGVASTKFVAKLATTRAKPDGLLVVPRDGVVDVPAPAAGLGAVGRGRAHRGGADPARAAHRRRPRPHPAVSTLERALGPAAGAHLAALAWGRDERRVVPHEPDKSIGAEETFATDVDDPAVIHRELLRLSERVAVPAAVGRVRRAAPSRSRCASPTSRRSPARARCARPPTSGQEIYATARSLYDALGLHRARIRLVGRARRGPRRRRDPHPAAAARRARARVARGRAGGRLGRRGGSVPGPYARGPWSAASPTRGAAATPAGPRPL